MAFSVATVMDFCYVPMKFKTRCCDLKTIFTATEIEPAKSAHTDAYTHTLTLDTRQLGKTGPWHKCTDLCSSEGRPSQPLKLALYFIIATLLPPSGNTHSPARPGRHTHQHCCKAVADMA